MITTDVLCLICDFHNILKRGGNMKKSREIVFLQCLLCAILVFGCVTLKYRENTRTVQVSGFGFKDSANDTLSDLAGQMFEKYGVKTYERV